LGASRHQKGGNYTSGGISRRDGTMSNRNEAGSVLFCLLLGVCAEKKKKGKRMKEEKRRKKKEQK